MLRFCVCICTLVLLGSMAAPVNAASQYDKTLNQIGTGLDATAGEAGYPQNNNQPSVSLTQGWVQMLNFLLVLTSLIFMIMVLYGGWLWMYARGNEQLVETGRAYMVQAVIGILIVFGARIIVELAVTGITSQPQSAATTAASQPAATPGDFIINPGSDDGSWQPK